MHRKLQKLWRAVQQARIAKCKKLDEPPVVQLPPDCKQLRDGRIFSVRRKSLSGHTYIWCYIQNNLVMYLMDKENNDNYLIFARHAPYSSNLVQKYQVTELNDTSLEVLYGLALAFGLDKF